MHGISSGGGFVRLLTSVALGGLLAAAPAGCDSDPVDAAGSYTLALTSGENGCEFADWEEGAETTGVPFVVRQEGDAVTAEVEGPAGLFLAVVLGSNVFEGEVDGSTLSLTLFGTSSTTTGGCAYTVNGVAEATLDGDVIEGEIEYRTSTNGSPDCGDLEGCSSVQRFNGTRPPR